MYRIEAYSKGIKAIDVESEGVEARYSGDKVSIVYGGQQISYPSQYDLIIVTNKDTGMVVTRLETPQLKGHITKEYKTA